VAFTWLGIYFLAFLPVIAWEAIALSGLVPERIAGPVLAITVAALALYGFLNAQRLRTIATDVPAPAALLGKRIAQISDVHVGSRQPGFLARVVRHVNAERPDLVMITGDLIDFRNIGEDELAPLSALDAPAWFCTGNHERYVDLDEICARLTRLGVRVLRNEAVDLGDIQIAGIDDAESRDQVAEHLPAIEALPDRFRILLYHRPDGAEAAARWGAHLMLCGHTHAGQIFPFNYLVRRVFARLRGDYRIGDMLLHVSTGTGKWGPVLRIGSASEVGLFTLTSA
jgi:predicted MPP superfamily phosphohydrolase